MFSIIFAASASLIEDALKVPALMIDPYNSSTQVETSLVLPEVIFFILVNEDYLWVNSFWTVTSKQILLR